MRKFTVALSALCVAISPALAEQNIGSASSIEKDVQGATGGRSTKLSVGDAIYLDEVLTTGAASRGKFTFADRTNLQMGPASRVKLDNFVYSGGAGVGFNAAKGAFRFVSAKGPHEAYEVKTPTATIGVRGTTFGVRVVAGRTDAILYDGEIEVCSTATGKCERLTSPCTIVSVTNEGVTRARQVSKGDWDFDGACMGFIPGQQGAAPPPPPPAGVPPEFQLNPGITGALLGAAAIGGGVAAGVSSSSSSGSCTNKLVPISGGSIAICN